VPYCVKLQTIGKGKKESKIEQIEPILEKCELFNNVEQAKRSSILERCGTIKTYEKGAFVFEETDAPSKLYILISGKVAIFKDTMSGKRILITGIEHSGEMFGEIYLFLGCESYGMYAQAQEDSVILRLTETVFESRTLQNNMMHIFAKKAYAMNRKIKILGGSDIREKVVRYLFEWQGADGEIHGDLRREEMADYMNVARPSLSRELGKMQEEGIIRMEGRRILIADREKFESFL